MSAPKVGDWFVGRSSAGYSWKDSYDIGLIEKVTAKQVQTRSGYGRRYSRDDIVPLPNEASARLLLQRINSAQAEAQRRISAAQDWGRREVAKILHDALLQADPQP